MNLSNSISTKSVLIVDNNVHETSILNEYLQRSGFQVEVVTKANQAITCVRQKDYQMVLVDQNLKDEIGCFEMIWMIKTLVKGIKIVLLSEQITREYELRALSHGVYHWICKPIKKNTAVKEIVQILLDTETERIPVQWNLLKTLFTRFTGKK